MNQEEIDALAVKASKHVKAGSTPSEYISECTAAAVALVETHVGGATVPTSVLHRAVIEVAADLYYRRNAQNGIAQFDNGEALDALRIGNDPLRPAKAMLRPFLGRPLA